MLERYWRKSFAKGHRWYSQRRPGRKKELRWPFTTHAGHKGTSL